MINYAAATSPSSPHPRRAVAVALTGRFDVARRALLPFVATVAPRLLNRRPEVNAATAGPVHLVGIPDDAKDSGSSVVQEEGGNNPSHVVLFLPNSELLTQWSNIQPPIPENASFAAPVQEASHPMTSSRLPQYGAQSSVRRPPGQLESQQRENITSVTGAHPAQHVLPPFEPRGHNKWWRMCEPMRDNEHLDFLVKASELSANGALVLSFGGFAAAYYSKQDLGGMAKSVHETLGGKICFISVTLIMYGYTLCVSSMAKAAEHNRSGLGKLPVQVIVIFSYLVLLGAFMTQCVTGAAIWKIAPGVAIVIAIMLVTWARTFNRPKILRRFLFCWGYFGRDPAAAQVTEDDRVARATADRVSSAKTAFVAQLTSEDKAAIAKVRADEASEIQAKVVQELAVAKNRAENAFSDLEIARERVLNDEADADSVQLLCEAKNAYVTALKARVDVTKRALKAAVDVHNKKIEARAADEEAKSAATFAQEEYERAATAKKISEL